MLELQGVGLPVDSWIDSSEPGLAQNNVTLLEWQGAKLHTILITANAQLGPGKGLVTRMLTAVGQHN